ncbi:aldo/keto reductase [Clostridiales bacterium]
METKPGMMPLLDGTEMPRYGFGCYASYGHEISQAVAWALECGYRYIDSAAMYANEKDVGEGLRLAGLDRKKVYILSKVWPKDYEVAANSAQQSLRDLGVDYLDCCLLHWPGMEEKRRLSAYEQLLRLKDQGLIRSVAVSNFQADQLERIKEVFGAYPPINEIELHPAFQQRELRQFCLDRGIALVAYSPIKRGAFMGDPRILSIGEKYGKTANQVVLRWHLERQQIPIPKSSHYDRIRENFDVFDFSLTPEETQLINSLECGGRRGNDPLTYNG